MSSVSYSKLCICKLKTMNVAKLKLKLIFLPLFFAITIQSHLINPIAQTTSNDTVEIALQPSFEVTLPLLTDDITPACSVDILNHNFANTIDGLHVSVNYTPPPSTCEWSIAVLEFRAECKGEQHDRVAGVWIDGVELLRTSTPQPTVDGIFWNVRKDVTRYSSIIAHHNRTLTVMLDNRLNDDFTGDFNVNVSVLCYSLNDVAVGVPISFPARESLAQVHSLNRKLISAKNHDNDDKLGLDRAIKSVYPYDTPADLIIPISGALDEGFWFKIQDESDVRTANVQISPRTYKAVLELYVSFHGDDEFWYMNPPDSYLKANNLPDERGKGMYREVLVTVDGNLVGTVIPFPVIFSGGINPLFWKPVVSIGAFDLPSYDIDLTPFLGLLLYNKSHSIGIQIADGISYWLVDANLHIWLADSNVQAIVEYEDPSLEIEQESEFEGLDGEFEIELERTSSATGWVQSSLGILKTKVTREIIFKNKLKFEDSGTKKQLEQEIKTKTKIKITDDKDNSIAKTIIENIYPLKITTVTSTASSKGTSVMNTSLSQARIESYSNEDSSISRVLNHQLDCIGSMLVKGNSVLSGYTENHQNYNYQGEVGCYSRRVDVVEGNVTVDQTISTCGA